MPHALMNILNGVDAFVYVSDLQTGEILFANRKTKETFNLGENGTENVCWKVFQAEFTGKCPFCPLFALENDPDTPVVWEEKNTITGRYYRNIDSIIEWTDKTRVHLHYAVDITDTRTAQHEASNMLEILKNILNGMDAYVYVSEMETDEILFINNRMKTAFGLGDDAVGKTCWQVLQSGFTERCSFCPNFRFEKKPHEIIVWEEHNTVTGRHYKNVDSVIEWMDGKKVHMQHSTDITDIMEAQRETRAVRERLETALASSQAGVWELDFGLGLLTYDAMCAGLFGLDPRKNSIRINELIAYLETIAPSDANSPDLIEGLRSEDPYRDGPAKDYCLVFPDGTERYVRNYGNTFRDKAGKVMHVIGMSIDITQHVRMENDLKAAKNAAENASRAKSQFLSNMSHEIRTPMNAIIGMTEILLHENLNDRQRHYLDDIRVSATALLEIVNDILDFSKIEAGKFELAQIDYNFPSLLYHIESIFTFAAKKKNITFRMELRSDIPPCLYGDDVRLSQVLINIIGNAVKFTAKGGVTLTVDAGDGMLRFAVSDTGVGIKEEDMPNIFKDFDRFDLCANRTISGTGLGLSITRNLVSMMGGSIHVTSEYGAGTTFFVEFPLIPGNPANMDSGGAEQDFISAPDAQVLVVDDNEVNLNVAAGLLRLFDISCDTAMSGSEAIGKIEAKKYDIVFMDHMMPGMDGVETTLCLRERYGMDELVVVALTANAVEGARESLLDADMNDYLSKPIEKEKLNQILGKWLPADKLRHAEARVPAAAPQCDLSPLLARVAAIEGVDVRLGLDRIGGMQDAFTGSLGIFARRAPETADSLAAFLERDDVRGFAVAVHGLKGSLHNIGATGLALQAEELEHKARENDLAFCKEHLPALRDALGALHAGLAEALAREGGGDSAALAPGDRELLLVQLPVVRDLVNSFEGDEALTLLRNLRAYDYGADLNGTLKDVCRLVEEFAYDEALVLLDRL